MCEIPTEEFSRQISDSKIQSKIEHNYHHYKKQSEKWEKDFEIYQDEHVCEKSTDENFIKLLEEKQFDESIFSK